MHNDNTPGAHRTGGGTNIPRPQVPQRLSAHIASGRCEQPCLLHIPSPIHEGGTDTSPFHRRGPCGPESVRALSKITRLAKGEAGVGNPIQAAKLGTPTAPCRFQVEFGAPASSEPGHWTQPSGGRKSAHLGQSVSFIYIFRVCYTVMYWCTSSSPPCVI